MLKQVLADLVWDGDPGWDRPAISHGGRDSWSSIQNGPHVSPKIAADSNSFVDTTAAIQSLHFGGDVTVTGSCRPLGSGQRHIKSQFHTSSFLHSGEFSNSQESSLLSSSSSRTATAKIQGTTDGDVNDNVTDPGRLRRRSRFVGRRNNYMGRWTSTSFAATGNLKKCGAGYRCVSRVSDFLLHHDGRDLQGRLEHPPASTEDWQPEFPKSEEVQNFYEDGCPFVGITSTDTGTCSPDMPTRLMGKTTCGVCVGFSRHFYDPLRCAGGKCLCIPEQSQGGGRWTRSAPKKAKNSRKPNTRPMISAARIRSFPPSRR